MVSYTYTGRRLSARRSRGGGTRDGMDGVGQETWGDSPGLINDIPTGVVYMISQLAGSTLWRGPDHRFFYA